MKISFYRAPTWRKQQQKSALFPTVARAVSSRITATIHYQVRCLYPPVGQLVLSSPQRSNNELLDLANVYVRAPLPPSLASVAAPPFGGNVRTIVIKANPDQMAAHNLTPDQFGASATI